MFLRTDDPVERLLPSRELLQMQWLLHRVLALSGVADASDEEPEPDSEMEDNEWDRDGDSE